MQIQSFLQQKHLHFPIFPPEHIPQMEHYAKEVTTCYVCSND